jgi:hypothetical protein
VEPVQAMAWLHKSLRRCRRKSEAKNEVIYVIMSKFRVLVRAIEKNCASEKSCMLLFGVVDITKTAFV